MMRLDRQFPEKDNIVRGGLQCALYWFAEAAKTGLRDGCFDFNFCMEKAEEGMIIYYPRSFSNGWETTAFPYDRKEWQQIWEKEKDDFEQVALQYVQERKSACMISSIHGTTAVPLVIDALKEIGMNHRVFPMRKGVKVYVEVGKDGEYIVLFINYVNLTEDTLSKLRDCVLSLKDMTGMFQIPICVRKLTAKERTAFNNGLVR